MGENMRSAAVLLLVVAGILAAAAGVSADPGISAQSAVMSAPSTPNLLYLELMQESIYVRPGENAEVVLKQANTDSVSGYQAFLRFSTDRLVFDSGIYTASPYDMYLISPIVASGADINLAAGKIGVAAGNASLAILTFHVPAGTPDGEARISFRQAERPTTFTDINGEAVTAAVLDSRPIVIDSTPPSNVSISATPASWTQSSLVDLNFSASDANGVDHYELSLDGGAFFSTVSPYHWDTGSLATGIYPAVVKAVDMAGNEATAQTQVFIDRTKPEISISSISQDEKELSGTATAAVQGVVNITVRALDADSGITTPPVVTVKDAAANVKTLTATGSGPWTYTYNVDANTANGTAAVTAIAADAANNTNTALGTFTINKSTLNVNIQLLDVWLEATSQNPNPTVTRTIKIVIGGNGGTVAPIERTVPVVFDKNGKGKITLSDLPYNGLWTSISAKDEQHTIRTLGSLLDPDQNKQFIADLTLIGGDANNDNVVDIRDHGVFSGQYGTHGHPFPDRDADFSCDGQVWSEDYTFIHVNFLKQGGKLPGSAAASSLSETVPLTTISVSELGKEIGPEAAQKADINNDGVVDMNDIKLFMSKHASKRELAR